MWRALRISLCSALWLTSAGATPSRAAFLGATDPEKTSASPAYRWQLPRGFPVPAVPADNPMSAEKVSLGRLLFYETQLSVTGAHSCASCHVQALAFTDGRARAIGATGEHHPRSAMSLTNVAYNPAYTWIAPGLASLEAQLRQPLFNEHPIELGLAGREQAVLESLRTEAVYRAAFARAFPDESDPFKTTNLVRALASFTRALISGRSPFDRYVFEDERAALDESAKRGMALFFSERTGCAECHSGINFSGPIAHAAFPRVAAPFVDTGAGRLRVPTLRNVAVSAPYMHDGRLPTLEAVIDHYAAGAPQAARGDAAGSVGKDERLRGFPLSEAEKADLVAFLHSLTDREFLGDPDFGPPPAGER